MKSSLSDIPPDLVEALARARPRLGLLASPLIYFSTIESTNDAAATLEEGAVVIAETQTAGRGRRGHRWFSPAGSGLYVSVVLAPRRARTEPARASQLLTLAIGVALAEAIERSTSLRPNLKWPNDLHLCHRKVAGILAEGLDAKVVVGYGINLGSAAYPPELAGVATSIESELGRPVDRNQVLVETLASVAARYRDLLDGGFDAILDAWRARADGARGKRVAWSTVSGPRTGVTVGIDDFGALLVETDRRVERIVGGQVIWL